MISQNLSVGFFIHDMHVELWGTTRELHFYYGIIFFLYFLYMFTLWWKESFLYETWSMFLQHGFSVHVKNRRGCRRTDCKGVYPLGVLSFSSFNLNKIRLPCLVGCLEEYDNKIQLIKKEYKETKTWKTKEKKGYKLVVGKS